MHEEGDGAAREKGDLSSLLRERILAGDLRPGDKLPTEAELSSAYAISRPRVREAIAVLRAEDLVVSRRGSGSYVSAQPRVEIRLSVPSRTLDEVVRMIELRRAIECEATKLAALRRTPQQLHALRAAERSIHDAEAEGRDGVDEDFCLHRLLAEAAHNRHLLKIHDACRSVLVDAMRTTRANERREAALRAEVHAEHARILFAVEAGEGEWASEAMARHLAGAERRLLDGAAQTASPA